MNTAGVLNSDVKEEGGKIHASKNDCWSIFTNFFRLINLNHMDEEIEITKIKEAHYMLVYLFNFLAFVVFCGVVLMFFMFSMNYSCQCYGCLLVY